MILSIMKTVGIIQARMGSTRLPGKVLINILGNPMLYYVINRLKHCKYLDDVIVATSDELSDDAIVQYCIENNVNYFRGSENDVLSRFVLAASNFDADIIVRVTADCPLIDPLIVDNVICKHIENNADYSSNFYDRYYPRGVDVEVINFSVLKEINSKNLEKHHREHVTPYIYENPNKYKIHSEKATGKFIRPDLRITVDTKEDLLLIRKIYLNLYTENNIFTLADVIDLLEKKPELIAINRVIQQKTIKEH
jgi:spore coat polysaccharide biosynthesis protein SpsF